MPPQDKKRSPAAAAQAAAKTHKTDDVSSPAAARRTGADDSIVDTTAAHLSVAFSQDSVSDSQLAKACEAVEEAAARAASGGSSSHRALARRPSTSGGSHTPGDASVSSAAAGSAPQPWPIPQAGGGEGSFYDRVMAGLREQVSTAVSNAVAPISEKVVAEVGASLIGEIADLDKKLGEHRDAVQVQLNGVNKDNEKLAADQVQMRADLNRLESAFKAAQLAVPLQVPQPQARDGSQENFDADIDVTIARVRSHDKLLVQKSLVFEQFAEVFDEMGLDKEKAEHVRIEGDNLANEFVLRFGGGAHFAEKKRNAFFGALHPKGPKTPDMYRKYAATAPSGVEAKLYIKRDTNGRIDKTEKETKVLFRVISDLYPELAGEKRLWNSPATGEITQKRVPVVRVAVQHAGPSTLDWNLPLAEKLGIDPVEVREKFRSFHLEGAQVTFTTV